MKKRSWPKWWDWELEFTPHLYKRMDDRNFNELDIRTMLEHAHSFRADIIEGRWIIETRHRKKSWEVIVEPETGCELLIVITAYPVWSI
ncbi:DUF4258 domain-containing protein [Desulfococcaceae bacterium HSG8]|nr:DUF4258 domain-containing protein [Desulfococcaceae bacterium HSG8]